MRSQDIAKIEIPIPEVTAGYDEYTDLVEFADIPADKDIVLFFHADRCSSCKRIEEDIKNK